MLCCDPGAVVVLRWCCGAGVRPTTLTDGRSKRSVRSTAHHPSSWRNNSTVSVPSLNLVSDCGSCFGLCCVALPFAAGTDFAVDKAAGTPCRNLRTDFSCGIHERLRETGFPGCTVYDCFGAGQQVSQVIFGGRSWREAPETARTMYEVFPVVRQLHELLQYLTEALALAPASPVHGELRRALEETERLVGGTPEEILAVDVPAPVSYTHL